MTRWLSRPKREVRRVLRIILRKLDLHNSRFEQLMTGIIYANPFLKSIFFDTRRKAELPFPALREILLTLDHDELCNLSSNASVLITRFGVPTEDIARYLEYIANLGYQARHPHMVHEPLNFRLHAIFDFKIDIALVKIERTSEGITVTVHDRMFNGDGDGVQFWIYRILAVMRNYPVGVKKILDYYEALGEPTFFYLDISDGGGEYEADLPSNSHVFSFCRKVTSLSVGLIPDAYILHDLEYGAPPFQWSSKEDAALDYSTREKKLFWRGSSTGRSPQDSIARNQRIQFCIEALKYPNSFDVKITHVVQMRRNDKTYGKLARRQVTAPPVTEADFGKYVAYVDLEGNSAAWGSLRKYLLLVNVIRPEGNYSLFYHLDQPSNTFTSVGDVSEIFERSQADAGFLDNFEIAWIGYNFARDIRQRVIMGEATIFPK